MGSNSAGGMDVCLLSVLGVARVFLRLGCSLVQRSATECSVSLCDDEEVLAQWGLLRDVNKMEE